MLRIKLKPDNRWGINMEMFPKGIPVNMLCEKINPITEEKAEVFPVILGKLSYPQQSKLIDFVQKHTGWQENYIRNNGFAIASDNVDFVKFFGHPDWISFDRFYKIFKTTEEICYDSNSNLIAFSSWELFSLAQGLNLLLKHPGIQATNQHAKTYRHTLTRFLQILETIYPDVREVMEAEEMINPRHFDSV